MITKTYNPLTSQSHCEITVSAASRWSKFSGVLLSVPATRKLIEAQRSENGSTPVGRNGMIDYSGKVLEERLDTE